MCRLVEHSGPALPYTYDELLRPGTIPQIPRAVEALAREPTPMTCQKKKIKVDLSESHSLHESAPGESLAMHHQVEPASRSAGHDLGWLGQLQGQIPRCGW